LIVIDANLLLYAYSEQAPQHAASRAWLEGMFSSGEEIGIPVQGILTFIRVSTNAKLPGYRSPLGLALDTVDTWLSQPSVRILAPGPAYWQIFRRISLQADAAGNLSSDAHFAALAIEYDAVLYTADADFARFPGLRWKNPLAKS
jgi:toxin-antitoxin system PIN domain toxin